MASSISKVMEVVGQSLTQLAPPPSEPSPLRPLSLPDASSFVGTVKRTNALKGEPAETATEVHRCYPVEAQDAILGLLGIPGARADRRKVWFYDTPDRDLFRRGAIIRARDGESGSDLTVKLRPDHAFDVPDRVAGKHGFKDEADQGALRTVRSYSLRSKGSDDLTKGQREMLETYLGKPVDFGKLQRFGPAHVDKWKAEVDGVPYPISVESWTIRGGERLLEVSVKVPEGGDVSGAAQKLEALIARSGFQPAPSGKTKTERVFDAGA